MKRCLLLLFLIGGSVGCAPNLLRFKYKAFYSENDYVCNEKGFTLSHRISYNHPRIMDEEHLYTLEFIFLDTLAAKKKRKLNLAIDTNIVRCDYKFISIWYAGQPMGIVNGTIKILHWTDNSVVIKENLTASESWLKETIVMKGIRKFKVSTKGNQE